MASRAHSSSDSRESPSVMHFTGEDSMLADEAQAEHLAERVIEATRERLALFRQFLPQASSPRNRCISVR